VYTVHQQAVEKFLQKWRFRLAMAVFYSKTVAKKAKSADKLVSVLFVKNACCKLLTG